MRWLWFAPRPHYAVLWTSVMVMALLALAWPPLWWHVASGATRPGPTAESLVVIEVLGLVGTWSWPVASFAIVQAASVTYAALGYPAGPAGYSGLAVVAVLAVRCGRAWVRRAGLIVAIGGIAVVDDIRQLRSAPVVALANAALVALAWALGSSIRLVRERSVAIAEVAHQLKLREGEVSRREVAEARVKAASELHDHIGHALAAALRQTEAAQVASPARRAVLMTRVEHRLRDSLVGVGELVTAWGNELTSSVRMVSSPASPIAGILGEWIAALTASGVRVTLSVEGASEHASADAQRSIAAALDEAMANMSRHSSGAHLAIELHFDVAEVFLLVEDPGPPKDSVPGAGSGLAVLARRIESVGGSLRAGPTSAGGFTLVARLPAGAGAPL